MSDTITRTLPDLLEIMRDAPGADWGKASVTYSLRKAVDAVLTWKPGLYDALLSIDGEAAPKEPSATRTVGFKHVRHLSVDTESAEEVADEAFNEGVVRGVWLAANIARMVLGLMEPDAPGDFVGDIWFGDPSNRTRGTHRWDGATWQALPTDMEAVLGLLAEAREQGARATRKAHEWREEAMRLACGVAGERSAELVAMTADRDRLRALVGEDLKGTETA